MQSNDIDFLDLLNGQVQYVVPRWQRRYRWGRPDIERLAQDLLAVAAAGEESAHYGGTLLTFLEPGPAGVVKTIRVVDGQQRLTTVSILLACIAEKLGPNGQCGEWTAQIIRDDRLTNPRKAQEKRRKLRLQYGDEEEYSRGLKGEPSGSGAVTQAWRIARRLVARNDVGRLLRGLERLKVVSIGLGRHDDPQQIFESLNATGKPLTESEKVKNWLLMGLPDEEQQVMHDEHWLAIERALGAERSTEPIDIFLRDLLRWRTGEVHGIDQVYENFRRWVVRMRLVDDRPALCGDLARLAKLYGRLTGTAGAHPNRAVRSELQHLQAMGIDTHRPFTLRLFHDTAQGEPTEGTNEDLAKTLAAVNTWITRLWLADRQTAGMNRAIADLAHESGPGEGESLSEHWIDRIQRRRNTRVGVPSDEQVADGIRNRKAYGGSASQAAFAVLCSLMEAEHKEESPARGRLTLEHVMPQRLTDEWREALGGDAEEIHGRYRDRLANLTLSGDVTNAGLGAKLFEEKKQTYRKSTIGITRRLDSESQWNADAIKRRAENLSHRAVRRWPWAALETRDDKPRNQATPLRWRIDEGEWRGETAASQMVLNVAGALLARDPANAQTLLGESISTNIHPASRYPAGSKVGSLDMRAVPGYEEYVLYPYAQDYRESADRCRKMGRRCDVAVEVEFEQDSRTQAFWRTVKTLTGGVPGQKDSWRGRSQWTSRLNDIGDRILLYVGHEDRMWLYVRAGEREASPARAARMREVSWMMQDQMSDEILGNDLEKYSEEGRTISVERQWDRDDEEGWPDAAQWLKDQQVRLEAILDESLNSIT